MEPRLDEIITVKDKEKKYNLPYFSYRICCNHNVNGELELLRSIIKNTPGACIFDVGATGSVFPSEINEDMSLHLFDPVFKPSGKTVLAMERGRYFSTQRKSLDIYNPHNKK